MFGWTYPSSVEPGPLNPKPGGPGFLAHCGYWRHLCLCRDASEAGPVIPDVCHL